MSVQLAWNLSRSAVETPEAIHVLVMARVCAPPDPSHHRAPLNLSLVLDKSGSMAGEKLEQCKHAARFVVSHLTGEDRMSAVAFDTNVEVLVPPGPVAARDHAQSLLGHLRAGSSTNLSGGWLQGASHVEAGRQEGRINRVLLLTDGQANAGVVDHQQLLLLARGLAERHVQTTCIGFGADFNEDLLKGLADAGGGNFHFIQSPEEARSVFARELQELLTVAAQNVKLRIVPSRDVRLVEVLHEYPSRAVDGAIEVDLGDLLAGEDRPLLLHFAVPRDLAGRRGITAINLSFQQVMGEVAFRELSAFVETPDGGAGSVSIDPVVWREVLLTQSTREMKDAMADADQGDLDRARTRLLNSKQRLESSPHAQDPEYVERCHELDRLADMLRDQQEYSAHGRKSLHSSHGHYSRHKPHTRGGILQPALRKRLAVAQRLVFVTGPGLAPTRRPDRFDGVPIEGIERPARDERELARQWGWMRDRQVLAVQARGGGHEAIARMAGHGRWDDVAVVTSSYDGLHGYGVSRHVEVYGSVWRGRCPADGRVWGANLCGTASPEKAHAEAVVHDGVPRCACGAALRPDVVWEGEDVPSGTWDAAVAAVASADAVITAGTRLSTPPMRELIRHARGPVVGIGTIRGDAPEWAEAWVPMHAQGGLEALEAEITWY